MRKAPRGYCVSVLDSPTAPTGIAGSGVPGGSGTKFEVRHTTSFDERPCVTLIPPMDLLSSGYQCCDCITQNLGPLTFFVVFRLQPRPSHWILEMKTCVLKQRRGDVGDQRLL